MDLPEKFGKYLLVERIAVGGMAEVYKARTMGVGGFEKVLAVKRLHTRYCEDVDFIKMLIDEAKIAVQLSHSNICQIFDLDRMGEHYFISMEYIDGKDLNRVMRRLSEIDRKMPVEAACYLAREVCSGLDYAHRKLAQDGTPLQIVHRDVSPQNILLSWEGEVRIVDFGIAKAAHRAYETESGIIKGKFYYMSPEHAKGVAIDHRSDVFSLGIVLYECLTGDFLYTADDKNDQTLLTRVRRAEIAPPSKLRRELPKRLDQIVMKALAREPSDRYQSAAAFGDALDRFLHQHYPQMGSAALSAFMLDAFAKETAHRAPAEQDRGTFMSRVDYQVEGTSLIYDTTGDPDDESGAEDRSQSLEEVPMPKRDTFDDDPFFSGQDKKKPPSRDSSEITELDDADIDIIDEHRNPEPATAVFRGEGDLSLEVPLDPMDFEPTQIKHDAPDIHVEAELHADAFDDPMDHEPTQVYKPQAVLAASPGAHRGPLIGESRVDTPGERPGGKESDQATVITSFEDMAKRDANLAAAVASAKADPGPVSRPVQPIYMPRKSKSTSPTLIVAILGLVLALGAAMAVGTQMLFGVDERTEQIAAPTPQEIPAPQAATPTATYTINSNPVGARILIDGTFRGTTPSRVDDLEVGRTYWLRLEYDGHRTHEQPLNVAEAGDHPVTFTLDRMLGTVHVETVPPQANLSIDGIFRQRSPAILDGLDPRTSYVLSASLPGYLTAYHRLEWAADGSDLLQRVRLELTPIAPTAELTDPLLAGQDPTQAATQVAVAADGTQTTPTNTAPAIDEGARSSSREDRSASARRDDSEDASEERSSSRDRSSSRERSSARERSSSRHHSRGDDDDDDDDTSASSDEEGMGRISVRAEPEGQVFIDNEVVATETPLLDHELEPGNYRVKVYFVSLRQFSEERRVRIEAGGSRSVYFRTRE